MREWVRRFFASKFETRSKHGRLYLLIKYGHLVIRKNKVWIERKDRENLKGEKDRLMRKVSAS